jgi:hypothetical protein
MTVVDYEYGWAICTDAIGKSLSWNTAVMDDFVLECTIQTFHINLKLAGGASEAFNPTISGRLLRFEAETGKSRPPAASCSAPVGSAKV